MPVSCKNPDWRCLDTLVSITDVLALFHVTRTTLWRWRHSGYLVPVLAPHNHRAIGYVPADVERVRAERGVR